MARPDFRAVAARRLSEERELSPSIVSFLAPEGSRNLRVRHVPIDRIEPSPENPRLRFEESALEELASSIREHGVLQPILVRPTGRDQYQLVAGERRWRAARRAGLKTIPALVEELDDDAALEIAVIENLQREDLSPLEEATIYEKMVTEHGYSIRKLAQKLGKDKGYLENRLRLADAPEEIRALVSVRKDTLSHAYELMKVQDPKKRKRLAAQVASGQLSLVKLRERIEGRPRRVIDADAEAEQVAAWPPEDDAEEAGPPPATVPTGDDALLVAKAQFQEALGEFLAVLRSAEFAQVANATDRQNLAKYLTISKLSLENAITVVRGRGD
ncbi:MAG TPA: ParB/RepB/Spo0J family partition protein [Candidatus Nanopelagicales bacterium]|nr:ParB/RepB/Spo0J family partition protein [Candidatus Nanopelagicales bacterium]